MDDLLEQHNELYMFDSAPPNLPVEPVSSVPPVAPASGPKPVPSAGPLPAPLVVKGKKEPEDIFAGMDVAAEQKAANEGDMMTERAPHRSPMFIVGVVIAGLLVVGVAGYVIWAFVLQPKTTTEIPAITTTAPTPPQAPQQIEQPPVFEERPTPTPPSAPEPASEPVTQPPSGINIPLPVEAPSETPPAPPQAAAPTEGMDGDADKLTDAEESLYGTNTSVADSDGDGYADGAEFLNFFNPAAKGESITKNAGIVAVPWNGWSVLIPSTWVVSADPQDSSIGVFTTGSKTRFTAQARANASRQSLADWIGSGSVGMTSFTTKNGLQAMQSSDGLTTYLAAGDTILIVIYDLNGDPSYDYRTTYLMMVNAFRPPKS